jgi:hypothetical protein
VWKTEQKIPSWACACMQDFNAMDGYAKCLNNHSFHRLVYSL